MKYFIVSVLSFCFCLALVFADDPPRSPDDPYYHETNYNEPNQWYLHQIDAERAWHLTKGMNNVVVGIIDPSLADATHPELVNRFNVIDNSGDGSGGGGCGCSFHAVNQIAGLISVNTDNTNMFAGLGWNLKMNHYLFGSISSGSEKVRLLAQMDIIINLIDTAITRDGVKIINCSFAFPKIKKDENNNIVYELTDEEIQPFKEVIEEAINSGVIFIASAGNKADEFNTDVYDPYPACIDGVIGVTATNRGDRQLQNYNPIAVDVAAPGLDIYSTSSGSGCHAETFATGTSFSTPLVSALAGLILSLNGELSPQNIQSILQLSGDVAGGYKRINAYKALKYTLEHYGGTLRDEVYLDESLRIHSGNTLTIDSGISISFNDDPYARIIIEEGATIIDLGGKIPEERLILPDDAIIVDDNLDNSDGYSESSSNYWQNYTENNCYQGDAKFTYTKSDWARFTPQITSPGYYQIWVRWPYRPWGSGRSRIKYIVYYGNGQNSDDYVFNQKEEQYPNDGEWKPLGESATFPLFSGAYVEASFPDEYQEDQMNIIVDAVKFKWCGDIDPPEAPTNFTATAISSSEILLTWQMNATNNHTGFKIERYETNPEDYTQIGEVTAEKRSFNDTGLSPNRTYVYHICATNGVDSEWSEEASATTPPEVATIVVDDNLDNSDGYSESSSNYWQNYTENNCYQGDAKFTYTKSDWARFTPQITSPGYYQIWVRWPYRPWGSGRSRIKYIVYYGNGQNSDDYVFNQKEEQYPNDGEWKPLGESATFPLFSGAYVEASFPDEYQEDQMNIIVDAVKFKWCGDIDPPEAPTNFTATAISSSEILLTWQMNATNNHTGFKIERYATNPNDFTLIGEVAAEKRSFKDTGLTPNRTYVYHICAIYEDGDSKWSDEASATTPDVVPTDPTNLTGTLMANDEIRLSWQDSSNNEIGFKIERSESDNTHFSLIYTTDANAIEHTDPSRLPGTVYFYRVCATNGIGDSDWAGPVCIITPPPLRKNKLDMATGRGIVPEAFALHPNYPNPFNPSTTIRYDLPEVSHVKIKIYDMMGREVITLLDHKVEAGSHEVQWNGKDQFGFQVASGIYLLQFIADEHVFTKKILLMR